MGQKNEPSRPKNPKPAAPHPPSMQDTDAQIDEASDESFPASDPPANTPITHSGAPKRKT